MALVIVKQNIASALCKHLSLDPKLFSSEVNSGDLKSFCISILKSSQDADALANDAELMKWIGYAATSVENQDASLGGLTELNGELVTKSVLMGGGFTPNAADVIVFAALHSFLIGLSNLDKVKLPHLFRWADYIQNKEEFGQLFEKILVEKAPFAPQALKSLKKVDDSNAKKTAKDAKQASSSEANSESKNDAKKTTKEASRSEADSKSKRSGDAKKKADGASQASAEKVKQPEIKKEEELSVSLLKIQIGYIRKAWKHPSADNLLVEEIDVGEEKCRQVVSGLAIHFTPEELTNRSVVLITNVKRGKLRDVMSQGLVLCASNQDQSLVVPLLAPEGAKPGECVTFSGHDGKPEDVLNPKKKQLDKISPNLFTDDKGTATFKGIPFMTSSGPCTSSIPNASIK